MSYLCYVVAILPRAYGSEGRGRVDASLPISQTVKVLLKNVFKFGFVKKSMVGHWKRLSDGGLFGW